MSALAEGAAERGRADGAARGRAEEAEGLGRARPDRLHGLVARVTRSSARTTATSSRRGSRSRRSARSCRCSRGRCRPRRSATSTRWSRTCSSRTRRRSVPQAEIGVFGGSGFYSFLEDAEEVEVETPYGKPSAPLTIGEVGGRRVAFLPRHGRQHELPPHRIPYRANVWAMRELGVRRIIGPCASGRAEGGARARRVRRLRPVRRPDLGPRRHVLRRPRDDPRVRGRPVLRRPAPGCSSRRRASSASPCTTAARSS